MSNNFGLYFGNSTASIAQFREDGNTSILANEAGERVTPTVVVLNSSEVVVGSMAGATSYSLAPYTVRNNKTLLDVKLSEEETTRVRNESLVKINEENLYHIYETEKKPLVYSCEQIAEFIFNKLYGIGRGAATGQSDLNCVICVPFHWNSESRDIVRRAASDVGWKVRQIINEPAAALLAYKIGFEKPPTDDLVLVYRLGGVSCDVTLVQVKHGFYKVLNHVQHLNKGGKDIINSLTSHLAEEFRRKFHLDPNESRKSMWKLKIGAAAMLHSLSTLPSCSRFIESVCEGVDFNVTISRARLDALISPLLPSFTQPIVEVLAQAGLQSEQITKVILCGGPIKIPKIKSHIGSMFKCEILSSNPDEVYASGAAQQIGLMLNAPDIPDSSEKIPFLTDPISVTVQDKEVLIEPNYLPAFNQITINPEKQLNITASQKNLKGQVSMEYETPPKEVEVKIKVTINDEIHVEAIDVTSKEVKKAVIKLQ